MKQFSKDDIRGFVRDYRGLLKPYRGLFFSIVVWIFLMQVTGLAEPYAFKYVLDDVQAHAARGAPMEFTHLLKVLSLLFGVMLVGGVIQVAKNWRVNKMIFVLDRDLIKNAAAKLLRLPLSFHERENAGLLISKITKGIHKTIEVTAALLYEIIGIAIQTIVTAAVIVFISWQAFIVFAVSTTIFVFATVHVKRKLAPMRRRRHDEDASSYEQVGETIINIATVQTCAEGEHERQKLERERDGIYERGMVEFRTHFNYDHLRNGIVSLGRNVVLGLTAWAATGGGLSIGTWVFIVTLTEKVFISCYRLGSIFDRVQEAAESVRRMVEVLEEEERIKDPANPVDAPEFVGRIAFDKLTHQYWAKHPAEPAPKRRRPALQEISLAIAPGETIGIVGPSGSGKSTLVKLLLRVDDPTIGSVSIDGIDIRLMRLEDFRRQIGYVSQEVEIFDTTVAENIGYGCGPVTREKTIEAAKAANLHERIMSFPNGYDERVGNRGMRLSGGEKQRVGIARAVLKDARILVLDEATSQVDSISEVKIHAAIENLRKGRTTIMIAHRLSTVRHADRIVVMDEGRVKEIGTHAALVANKGLYAELVRLQREAEAKM